MLADAAALIANNLKDSVDASGSASLIVSGGSSPLPIFDALSAMALPWADITISLVDDRMVEDTDPASNVQLLKTHLLIGKAAQAQFISLKDMDETGSQIVRPFDVMLLGMGTDGHFASLFPDMLDPEIAFAVDGKRMIIKTPPRGNPSIERISMNLAMILDSRNLYLMVAGDEKHAVFERAKTDKNLPIHHLLQQQRTELRILKG